MEQSNTAIMTDAEGGYLPSVNNDHEDATGQQGNKKCPQRRWIMILMGVLSLIVIAIATTIPLFDSKDIDNPRKKLEKLQELQSTLLNFSEPLAFVRPDLPPTQALQYLAYKQDHFGLTARSEDQVLQLYVLLVLLFTCGGNTDLLSDQTFSECDIDYLTCDENGILIGIDMSSQKLSGVLPTEIELLTHLKTLDLRNNDIRGTVPSDSLRKLTSLERLWLGSNKFVSTISPVMSELTNLLTLELADNLLTGSFPSTFSNLEDITEFLVANNKFEGDIWPIALKWHNLTHLDIEETDLGGPIPTEIGLLSTLTYFKIRLSNIRGSVPAEITQLTKLRQLFIDGPLFEGSIPNGIGQMVELDSISFTGSNLGGSIPSSIGLLSNLQFVRIGDSKIRGTVPTELGNCPKLRKLSFEISELSGTLPSEFARLGYLETIYLESTAISFIPEEVCGSGVQIMSDCSLRCICCDHGGKCRRLETFTLPQ